MVVKMDKITRQLKRVANEIGLTNQILKVNSKLKVLYVTKELDVKLKQDFNFGKMKNQNNAKTDWGFNLSLFKKALTQDQDTLSELLENQKNKFQNNGQDDLYDEQTGKFIGIQLSAKKIKTLDWYLREMRQTQLEKYVPQIIELIEQFKQESEQFTNKYGEGKHGKKVADQFSEIIDQFTSKLNYTIKKYQNKYGKDLQKLPKEESEKLVQFFELFE